MELHGAQAFAQAGGYRFTAVEAAFLALSSGGNMPYMSLLFLFVVGDFDALPPAKGGKLRRRLQGVGYALGRGTALAAGLGAFALLAALPSAAPGTGWTEADPALRARLTAVAVPPYIQARFTPWTALLLAVAIPAVFWCAWAAFLFAMGRWRMGCAGATAYALAVAWNSVTFQERIAPWAPTQCCTLNALLQGAAPGGEGAALLAGAGYLLAALAIAGALAVLSTTVQPICIQFSWKKKQIWIKKILS